MTNIGVPIIEHGLLAMSETEWDLAVRTAALIGPLARRDVVGRRAAADAAAQLGVSLRQVYVLIERFRRGSGNVTDLLPGQSDGGRDTGRLAEPVEDVVQELIRTRYLKRQKLSLAALHRDIVQACSVKGLAAPSRSTVGRRIAALHPAAVLRPVKDPQPDAVSLSHRLTGAGIVSDRPVVLAAPCVHRFERS